MTASAPRIPQLLLEAIATLDDGKQPIAELCRSIGAEADARGYTRPSYEQVRVLVHLFRSIDRRRHGPSIAEMVWEVGAGSRTGGSLIHNMYLPRGERRRV